MISKEEQAINAKIDQATRPLRQRIDLLEREVRRLKSDLQNTKNAVNRMTRT